MKRISQEDKMKDTRAHSNSRLELRERTVDMTDKEKNIKAPHFEGEFILLEQNFVFFYYFKHYFDWRIAFNIQNTFEYLW